MVSVSLLWPTTVIVCGIRTSIRCEWFGGQWMMDQDFLRTYCNYDTALLHIVLSVCRVKFLKILDGIRGRRRAWLLYHIVATNHCNTEHRNRTGTFQSSFGKGKTFEQRPFPSCETALVHAML
eukprot:scaffold6710_cov175-Amphora_coffeaeformis.AAC.1